MGVANVSSNWVSGNLVFYDKDGAIIVTYDGTNRKLTLPSGSTLESLGTTTITDATLSPNDLALAQGSVLVGDSTGKAVAYSAKTTGRLLIGNGTTIASVALSSDATITSGGVLTIASSAVTTTKIGDTAVTAGKIGTGAVTSAKVGTSAILTTRIGDTQVTAGKIGTGAVTSGKIGTSAVLTTRIGDTAVTAGKIGSGAVTSAKIGTSAVLTARIGDTQVTSAKIASSGVTAGKIADLGVATGKIAAGAVTSAKIATSAVLTTRIGDAAVTAGKVGSAAISASKLKIATKSVVIASAGTSALSAVDLTCSAGTIIGVYPTSNLNTTSANIVSVSIITSGQAKVLTGAAVNHAATYAVVIAKA